MNTDILLPIFISTISLLASIITLYFTQLRPANISLLIGPDIYIYYADYPDFSTGIYIPMTFVNNASNMGTIYKSGITIYRSDAPQQKYFMLWREFQKIGENKSWVYDSQAHSFAITGKSSISKTAWFIWQSETKPKLSFREGAYILIIHVWIGNIKKPKNFEFRFHLTKEEEDFFNSKIRTESKQVLRIILNKDLERNRLLTEHESKLLLDL